MAAPALPFREALLGDLCSVVRTKNAGPFLFTLDIIFERPADYEAVKEQAQLSTAVVAGAYGVGQEEVVSVEFADGILAVKATLRRRRAAGAPGDTDCYGMSQEAPALGIAVRVPDPTAGTRGEDGHG